MRHIVLEDSTSYPVAILIKENAFNEQELLRNYAEPLIKKGVNREDIVFFTIPYNENGKAPVKFIKLYLEKLLSTLESVGVEHIYCADAAYFKTLAGKTKAEIYLGYHFDCVIKDYEKFKIYLGINHKSLIFNPDNQDKLTLSLDTLVNGINGNPGQFDKYVVTDLRLPKTNDEIVEQLRFLMDQPEISCDIEAFSLRHEKAGIATISFSWNTTSAVVFPVDYVSGNTDPNLHGTQVNNKELKEILKDFFTSYKGKVVWHGCTYDTKVIIYNLWMTHHKDTANLLKGLHILYKNIHDSKIIAYLALNTVADIKLGLKDLGHEYAGNWAQDDIKDVRKIPLDQLLRYNAVDTVCTLYVKEKYYDTMVQDQQLDLYETMMIPSQKLLTQIELTGMPLNPNRVLEVEQELIDFKKLQETIINSSPLVNKVSNLLTDMAHIKDFESRRDKAKHPGNIKPKDRNTFPHVVFNPNSNDHLRELLYKIMGLPVIDKTKTKLAATGSKVLEKLINHTTDQDEIDLIQAIIDWGGVEKILNTFITAMKLAVPDDNDPDLAWLHGSYNLGVVVSGRLSSSNP